MLAIHIIVEVSGPVTTHMEPEANHVWRIVSRTNVGEFGLAEASIVCEHNDWKDLEPDPRDAILLCKRRMHSMRLSQRPVLLLPAVVAKRFQELLKLLPLAPPTCKRFLMALAALAQTGAAKAAPQRVYFAGEEERLQALTRQDDFGDLALKIALALVIIGLTVMVSMLTYLPPLQRHSRAGEDGSPQRGARAEGVRTMEAAVQCDPIAVRDIACQSQCTYTAVRKEVGPFRFQPLPENSHGSWRG